MSRKLGIGFTPLETRHEVILETAILAERRGYDYVAVPEAWGYDAIQLLAQIAHHTERIELQTGILSIWGRTPATVAMTAATMQHLTGGRFTLGLGASTRVLTEGLHDVRFVEPASRLESFTTKVQALLAGDRLPDPVVMGARPLRLGIPTEPVPIYLAAMSPLSMGVVGRVADGWLPFLVTPSSLPAALRATLAHRGPDRGPLDVRHNLFTAVSADAAEARRIAAASIVPYLTVMGDVYPALLRSQGFGAELDAILDANESSTDGIVPAACEPLLRQIALYGAPTEAKERLALWDAAGATSLTLVMLAHASPDVIGETVEALAPTG